MPNGANSVHKQLRTELEDYIKSQYFGKSPLLLAALGDHIDGDGLLYQKPFIESSPAYVTVPNGIEKASIIMQNCRLRKRFPLLMKRETDLIKLQGSLIQRMKRTCNTFCIHQWLPF